MPKRAREANTAVRRALSTAALVAAASLMAAGCRAPDRPTLAQSAQRAADSQDWSLAARLWTAEFRAGGPDAALACEEAARAETMRGQLETAQDLLNEGLELYPTEAALWEAKGDILSRMQFRRAAEACLGRAIELEPKRTSALLARAELRIELGLSSAARSDLERCLEAGVDGPEVWLAYARSLAAVGELRPSFDAYARSFERRPGAPANLLAAAALYMGGKLEPTTPRDGERVLSWLNLVVAGTPNNETAHYWLGCLHEERGDDEQAAVSFERALEIAPDYADALDRLARLAHRRGDSERADLLARRALEIERRPARRTALRALVVPRPDDHFD